jgi:hypothetical protein
MVHLLDGQAGQQVTIGQFVAGMGQRGFGFCLIIFGILAAVSLPGVSTITALPVVLFSAQMVWGLKQPWVPAFLARRSFSANGAKASLERARPWLKRIEIFAKPRVSWFTRGPMERLIGLVCLLLACVIVLPGPFTNVPPAIAITLLGFAVAERDGVLAAIALVVAVGAFVLGLSAFIAIAIALWAWFNGFV